MGYTSVLYLVVCALAASNMDAATTERSATDRAKAETFSQATTPSSPVPPVPPVPSYAMAALGKLPSGLQNALVALLLGSGSVDMTSITQLFTSIPALLNGMDQTNRSTLSEVERICYEDSDFFVEEAEKGAYWTMSMLDSSGKPGPSMLRGMFRFVGNFEQCLKTESHISPSTSRKVWGDTCVVYINPPAEVFAASAIPTTTREFFLEWHLCVPDTCSGDTIKKRINSTLSQYGLYIDRVVCHRDIKAGPLGEDSAAVGTVVVTAVLCAFVMLGTALDLYNRNFKDEKSKPPPSSKTPITNVCVSVDASVLDKPMNGHINNLIHTGKNDIDVKLTSLDSPLTGKVVETNGFATTNHETKILPIDKKKSHDSGALWMRVLLCFSAVRNGEKILSVKDTPGTLTCLNAIRVLSMGWVILGHTFTFPAGISDDPAYLYDLKKTLGFQLIINGTLSVDSFFVLSGLLVTYLFLKETDKQGHVTLKQMVLYYVHRYWRLTPAYIYMIYIDASLVKYLTDGPTWTGAQDAPVCEQDWWKNILYINNLFEGRMCFGVSWFLANDMQFYVLAPLALVPLAFRNKARYGWIMKMVGICVLAGLVVTSLVTTAYYVYTIDEDITTDGSGEYFVHVYIKPWCRVGPFAIGAGVGYILHATKREIKLPGFAQGVIWIVAMVSMLAITMVTYDQHGPDRAPWGVAARTAHETIYRPVWALVLGWVILTCCAGKAGIIDWMLSWAWWQPLARLTYGAFLIHPVLMTLDMMGTFKFTVSHLTYMFFGYTCLSYILSLLLAVLVEAPMLQLERLALRK